MKTQEQIAQVKKWLDDCALTRQRAKSCGELVSVLCCWYVKNIGLNYRVGYFENHCDALEYMTLIKEKYESWENLPESNYWYRIWINDRLETSSVKGEC